MESWASSGACLETGYEQCAKAIDGNAVLDVAKALAGRLFSIARHITQDDGTAGDVLTETFPGAWPAAGEGHGGGAAWLKLVSTTVKAALGRLEKHRLHGDVSDDAENLVIRELFVWGDYNQESLARTTNALEHGMRSLDPMCRTVFVLRDIEDIAVEDVAAILDRSVPAIEVCLLRARLHLREMLARRIRKEKRF